jgi:hypothetical protein
VADVGIKDQFYHGAVELRRWSPMEFELYIHEGLLLNSSVEYNPMLNVYHSADIRLPSAEGHFEMRSSQQENPRRFERVT